MPLRRRQLGDHAITVGHQYGFAVRGKADVLAELVFEDLQTYGSHKD